MLTKNIVHDQLFFMFGEGRLLFKQELFSHVAREVLTHCWDLNWCTGQSNFSITSNITFSSDS